MNRGFERIPGAKPVRFGNPDASLDEFFDWFVRYGSTIPQSPGDGLTYIGNGPAIILHREPPFQVQLFICFPRSTIPEHSHPNVESYEVNVAGDVNFVVDGAEVFPAYVSHQDRKDDSGLPRLWGYASYVGAGVRHHATIGARGGAFFSVQKWLNGVPPTSVDNDWKGAPMGASHFEVLSQQFAKDTPGYEPYVAGQLCD